MGRIDGLPIELIAVILRDVLHHDIGEPGNHRWTNEPPIILQALSIAQVCKKWREFALNTPPLWTTFDGELHPLLIDYALQLSSDLPLKLCLDLQSYFGDAGEDQHGFVALQWDVVRKFVSQIPRTSHLVVRLFWHHAEAFISELTQEAPLLVHLEIDGEYGFDPCVLPRTVFDGKCPHLRHLVLRSCKIAYDTPLLCNLKTLVLSSCTWLTPFELIELFSKTPSLETLRLFGFFNIWNTQVDAVILPRLKELSMSGLSEVELCKFVLDSVRCPHALLRITIDIEAIDDFVGLFCACGRWLSFHDSLGVIDNLKIDIRRNYEDIQLEGFSSTDPTLRFSITISVPSVSYFNVGQVAAAGLLNLPLVNVHTLHFYIGLPVSQTFWAMELSKSLPNLRTVEVCPLSAPHWFEVFAWCMNCGATPCLLHGVQEVVVRRFPHEWPALRENMDIVRDARLAQGCPIVYRYEDENSQLLCSMYG